MPDFQPWPKIPRLASPFIITEKIDGTNSAVVIEPHDFHNGESLDGGFAQVRSAFDPYGKPVDEGDEWVYNVGAQSRNRLISPEQDNFGFAAWVRDNAQALVDTLGVGRHFGEWWGSGIQRGYGLSKGEKRFSLFNVSRYNPFNNLEGLFDAQYEGGGDLFPILPGLDLVPVLTWGESDSDISWVADQLGATLRFLREKGSLAAQGFMRPEGVVLFHSRSGQTFKHYLDPSEKGVSE